MHSNWDDLRFALALARTGTLSAAGRALGVNHTTVMRRIEVLQEALGARLFDKTPEGYVPTPAGEVVLRSTGRMEEEVQALERTIIGTDDRLTGPVRLTTLDIFADLFMETFADFSTRYPGLSLEVSVDNAARSLTRREADVALRATNKPPEHLIGRRLFTMQYAIYGAPALVARAHDEGLGAVPWLAWDERLNARITEDWMRQYVPRARRALIVDSAVIMRRAARAGVGLTFLPIQVAARERHLVAFNDPVPDFDMDVWLLTHSDLRRTARVRAFMEHLTEGVKVWSRPQGSGARPGVT